MTTIVFVHGTGVRKASYERRLLDVRSGIARIRPGWDVAPCYWGDEHGAVLHMNGASIPSGATRSLADSEYGDNEVLWWALERDPLWELRLLDVETPDLPLFNGSSEASPMLELSNLITAPNETVSEILIRSGHAEKFGNALAEILESDECESLLDAGVPPGDLAAPIARAVVARMLLGEIEIGEDLVPATIDGATRDQLVAAIVDATVDGSRKLGGLDVAKFMGTVAMRAGGSRYLDRKRASWSHAAAPMAGDVLVYLARGRAMREFIGNVVASIEDSVVILGHSLGGIAAVELVITQDLPNVQQMITVGSQAPLLYELDALPQLRFGTALPDRFPRWDNIYDVRDLLAYKASGVFRGRAHDHIVDNDRPFPANHSAYFFEKNETFYRTLHEILP